MEALAPAYLPSVRIAWRKDGTPWPSAEAQFAEHKGTIREFCAQRAKRNAVSSVWAEFGVENGTSARYFLSQLPAEGKLLLFDSFSGLPEAWSDTKPAGHRCAEKIPVFDDARVTVIPGWFKDTLPLDEPLGFVHIDCDLYSSTKEVLAGIQVLPGTVVLFDELFGYPGWQQHEYKALMEWQQPFRFIARDDTFRAAIEVL